MALRDQFIALNEIKPDSQDINDTSGNYENFFEDLRMACSRLHAGFGYNVRQTYGSHVSQIFTAPGGEVFSITQRPDEKSLFIRTSHEKLDQAYMAHKAKEGARNPFEDVDKPLASETISKKLIEFLSENYDPTQRLLIERVLATLDSSIKGTYVGASQEEKTLIYK